MPFWLVLLRCLCSGNKESLMEGWMNVGMWWFGNNGIYNTLYLSGFTSWATNLIAFQVFFFPHPFYDGIKRWGTAKQSWPSLSLPCLLQFSLLSVWIYLSSFCISCLSHMCCLSLLPISAIRGEETTNCLLKKKVPILSFLFAISPRNKCKKKIKKKIEKQKNALSAKTNGGEGTWLVLSITHVNPLNARCWPRRGTLQHVCQCLPGNKPWAYLLLKKKKNLTLSNAYLPDNR